MLFTIGRGGGAYGVRSVIIFGFGPCSDLEYLSRRRNQGFNSHELTSLAVKSEHLFRSPLTLAHNEEMGNLPQGGFLQNRI